MKAFKAILNLSLMTIIGLTLCALPVGEARAQAQAEQRRLDAQNASQGNSPALPTNIPQSAEESASGVFYDSEGYAVQTRSASTEEANTLSADFLYLIMMLCIAAFMGRLIKYKKWSSDVWVAIAASTIMVGAVIMAIMGSKSRIHARDYKVEVKEDGTVNNMQADAIREQIKSYRELESLAGKKWKIEAAGAAAFAGAGAYALMKHMKANAKIKACQSAAVTHLGAMTTACAAPGGQAACKEVAFCQATVSHMGTLDASFMGPPENSVAAGAKIETLSTTAKGAAQGCTGASALCVETIVTDVDMNLTYGVPVLAAQSEPELDHSILKFVNASALSEFWDNQLRFSSPYLSFFEPDLENITYHHDPHINSALTTYETKRFMAGQVQSLSVTQLPAMLTSAKNLSYQKLISVNQNQQNKLKSLIAESFFSQAHAWGVKEFGLAGAAAVAYYTTSKKTATWLDSYMYSPQNRAIVFGIAATVATGSALLSKKTEGQMGGNAKKLEELLADIERLQNSSSAFTSPSQQRPGVQTGLAPSNIQAPVLANSGEKTPCIRDDKGCVNVESAIKNDPGLTDFGSTMSNLATLSGKVADGMMGTDSLSEGVMGDVEALAGMQGVANKLLNRAQEEHSKKLTELSKKPVDLGKITDNALRNLQAATVRSLNEDQGSRDTLASNFGLSPLSIPGKPGSGAISETDREELESALADGGGATGVGAADAKGLDFNFNFDDGTTDGQGQENLAMLGVDGMSVELDDYEAIDDIVSNRDVSLFQIITVRYFKSGFPRLFEIEE